MPLLHAVILGVIQGLTEVFPVSSSAHLVIIPWLLGWRYQGVTFDVALHIGTALAFLLYFFGDWVKIVGAFFKKNKSAGDNLFGYIIVGTIPAAVAGLLLEKKADEVFRSPLLILSAMAVFAVVLWLADRFGKKTKAINQIDLAAALKIGCAQILALVPGVSRSGITITAGLMEGFSREAAARFTFLLATPIVFAAGVLKLHKLHTGDFTAVFWAGVAASAVSGFFAIKFFLIFVKRFSLNVFVIYRIAAVIFLLFIIFMRHSG